ncbi:MAG: hypothetical protein AAF579_05510 [Cyanobacteria bacterium P01_C01_bin.118]
MTTTTNRTMTLEEYLNYDDGTDTHSVKLGGRDANANLKLLHAHCYRQVHGQAAAASRLQEA